MNQILSVNDRTPYTYFIRWNDLDLNYYGRRTAKGCQPEEFFISYFTSSKLVEDTIAEYGMPDVIKVHKYFSTIPACRSQEERFLTRVKAARNPRFLNQTNGDSKFDTTGKSHYVVILSGKIITTYIDDPRILSGEIINVNNGKNLGNKNRGDISGENNPMYGKFGENNPNFGQKRTNEFCEKQSIATTGNKNPMYGRTGDNNILSKLTSYQIESMKQDYLTKNFSLQELSDKYNVSYVVVKRKLKIIPIEIRNSITKYRRNNKGVTL